MLSKGAFNALLKTLEEPPENVMFILATTEENKLPATIMSRCLRFDFKRVAATEIIKGMKEICSEMKVEIDDQSLALLAANADGSVRDGLSILEQCISAADGKITRDLILEVIGSPGDQLISELTNFVMSGQTAEALIALGSMLSEGKEERRVMEDWIEFYRSALIIKYVSKPENVLSRSLENIDNIRKLSENMTTEFINKSIYELSKVLNDSRWSSHPRILLEMYIIEMSTP
jgi:DNA polymerase-3 subunit gamma/tau